MWDVNQAQWQEAALNYLTGWFLITQEHIRKGGGPYLPKGCLDNILKETMVAFGLEKLKLKKKTIYKRAWQNCLALSSSSSPYLCHHDSDRSVSYNSKYICKAGWHHLPIGYLDKILKETTIAFGLEKLKLKKTIYKRARQHCLALYPHRHLHMLCHHNYITMEEFKNIVERLVNWDLIHLLNFDKSLSTSSLSMAWLSQVLITFDLQLEDMWRAR
jgi:translation elongation factor EF-1beta